ncbi:MAG: SBBP repeat-containing protein, partial [Thermoplasmata archaeon]|nr:SBBP repeat-containing protein [Thermoplasmata archaeon]
TVFINGFTPAKNFTTTPGVLSRNNSGRHDCIVSKLSTQGTLLASTYIGGSRVEVCRGLIVDDTGDIYLSGTTDSNDFPTTSGSYCETRGPERMDMDNFVMKISGELDTILYSTFIGGTDSEELYENEIEMAADGSIFLGITTQSDDFDTTPNAFGRTYGGGNNDGVVCKLSHDLSTLLASTYIGRKGEDFVMSIDLGSDSTVYVGGDTDNDDGFPLTPDAFDDIQEDVEGFVSIFDEDLTTLIFSSFIGAEKGESAIQVLLSSDEEKLYINGWTQSLELNATIGSYDNSFNGYQDIYMAALNLTSMDCEHLTYFGSAGLETTWYSEVVENGDGHLVMTGFSYHVDFPTTSKANQTVKKQGSGWSDAFVLIMDPEPCPPPPGPILNATAGDGLVNLTWELDIEWCVIYNYTVYRGTAEGIIDDPIHITPDLKFDDTTIINGVTYYYQVSARNSAGLGSRSEIVTALPLGSPSVVTNL